MRPRCWLNKVRHITEVPFCYVMKVVCRTSNYLLWAGHFAWSCKTKMFSKISSGIRIAAYQEKSVSKIVILMSVVFSQMQFEFHLLLVLERKLKDALKIVKFRITITRSRWRALNKSTFRPVASSEMFHPHENFVLLRRLLNFSWVLQSFLKMWRNC